jgi:hypothetical protein
MTVQKDETKMKIQETRAKLKKLILEQVKPIRTELDNLLKEEAARLCPFCVNDIITLENGKTGKINAIDYHSLNYLARESEFSFMNSVMDEIDYIYAYVLDDKEFSITWKISGLRMINNGTEEGKIPFRDISPDRYNIDIVTKTVIPKKLNDYLTNNLGFLTNFSNIG